MKKLTIFILMAFMSLTGLIARADSHGQKEQKHKEFLEVKMKFLAEDMDLTDSQKKKFFDLYEEMSLKKAECYRQVRELEKKLKKEGKNAPESEYQKATEALNKANAEAAEIDRQYNAKFSEFLSQKQIYQLKEAENNFKARLEEMKRNKKKGDKQKK